MSEDIARGSGSSDEEMQKQVWPTILELQRVLVDRLKGTTIRPGGGDLAAISITSCEHHSCA